MSKLVVKEIVRDEDRTLLYGHEKWADYHVIAPYGLDVVIGDTVEYEPAGYNFGWFKSIKRSNK